MEPALIIVVVIAIALGIRLIAGSMDRQRICQYVEAKGGRVIDIAWSPFGPGWFGERSDRIYSVQYVDPSGQAHDAYCKTSFWTGVYFTEDTVLSGPTAPPKKGDLESLEEENRRLREELKQLKTKS